MNRMRLFVWNFTRKGKRTLTNSTAGWKINCGISNSLPLRRLLLRARTSTKILTLWYVFIFLVCIGRISKFISVRSAMGSRSIWPTVRPYKELLFSISPTLMVDQICGETRQWRNEHGPPHWVLGRNTTNPKGNCRAVVSILLISVWLCKVYK